ncbi:MAG: glycosyltransferase family 2 protein [Bacteroidales bacterium]|nr:glycosyltransferase family 2 protein [Bacteroidales bacterium]
MNSTIKLSLIIPVFNEEQNIIKLFNKVIEVINKLTKDYEVIFINDGSTDKSLEIIKDLSVKGDKVRFIDFSRNFGHQLAVMAGLEHCKGKKVVIIDADLQDPPDLIVEMYKKMDEGYDVVYAKRKKRKGENFFKKVTAKIFYRLLSNITSFDIPIDTGDFRIINRRIIEVLKQMPEQHKYLRGQIAWMGFNQTYVEYERKERHAGKTGYSFKKMSRFALDGITSFSDFPLKLATFMGFIVAGIAFLLILYALYSRFIIKDFVPGWASLMLSVLFIGGVQLISIGIIGEYISRIAANGRKRPLYLIKETNINE